MTASATACNHARGRRGRRPVRSGVDLLVFRIVADHPAAQRGIGPGINRAAVNPEPNELFLRFRRLDSIMRAIEQGQKPAGGRAQRSRRVVAAGHVPPVGKKPRDGQHVITVAKQWAMIAREDEPAGPRSPPRRFFVTVAINAERIQNWLDVARIIKHFRRVFDGFNFTWRPPDGLQLRRRKVGRFGPFLMATNATLDFARLDARETLHPFYG